ncbi:MAG: YbhB/YbcL family Raf kinase inhibitor-like protein [Actinomycetota bacterium]
MHRSVVLGLLLLAGCNQGGEPVPEITGTQDLEVTSRAFSEGDRIPTEYTCDGDDVAPALSWSSVDGAAQYAIAVTDPDAPGGTFLHWLAYGIPGETNELPKGEVPSGATQLANDFGNAGYAGPCPPAGKPHRYIFTVYALSSPAAESDLDARAWLDSVKEDVIASGELTGTYSR